MSAWPACLCGGRGWGKSCVCLCVWDSGSDRHTFTPHTPIASLLPLLPCPTPLPCSHVAGLHSVEPGCYLKHASTTVYLLSASPSVLLLLPVRVQEAQRVRLNLWLRPEKHACMLKSRALSSERLTGQRRREESKC